MSILRRRIIESALFNTNMPKDFKAVFVIENNSYSAVRINKNTHNIEGIGVYMKFSYGKDTKKSLHLTIKNIDTNEIVFNQDIYPHTDALYEYSLQGFTLEFYSLTDISKDSDYMDSNIHKCVVPIIDPNFDLTKQNFYEISINEYDECNLTTGYYYYESGSGKDSHPVYIYNKTLYKVLEYGSVTVGTNDTIWHPDAIKE